MSVDLNSQLHRIWICLHMNGTSYWAQYGENNKQKGRATVRLCIIFYCLSLCSQLSSFLQKENNKSLWVTFCDVVWYLLSRHAPVSCYVNNKKNKQLCLMSKVKRRSSRRKHNDLRQIMKFSCLHVCWEFHFVHRPFTDQKAITWCISFHGSSHLWAILNLSAQISLLYISCMQVTVYLDKVSWRFSVSCSFSVRHFSFLHLLSVSCFHGKERTPWHVW